MEAKASGTMCMQGGAQPCLDVLGPEMRVMETFVSGLLCLFYTHILLGYKHLRFCDFLHDLLEFVRILPTCSQPTNMRNATLIPLTLVSLSVKRRKHWKEFSCSCFIVV